MPIIRHAMCDLETLGTRPGDAILSIGAVIFSPENDVSTEFYVAIDPKDSKAQGFTSQKSTREWWQGQSVEAQTAAFSGKNTVREALDAFDFWMRTQGVETVRLWGNGAGFDNVLLEAAFAKIGMAVPWKFYNNRCYRTLKGMYPDVKLERQGVYHNALDDAKTQAAHLQLIVKTHGLTLG